MEQSVRLLHFLYIKQIEFLHITTIKLLVLYVLIVSFAQQCGLLLYCECTIYYSKSIEKRITVTLCAYDLSQ